MTAEDPRSRLPKVGDLLMGPEFLRLAEAFGRKLVKEELNLAIEELRQNPDLLAGMADPASGLAPRVLMNLTRRGQSMRPVINATGILIHTNLGRTPLSSAVMETFREKASGYLDLELDLETGRRGGRGTFVEERVRRLAGAEAALVVNNNAAAVLLVLASLVKGKEVVISRGELVEIGGSFRIPDVLRAGGALLRECGTTNRTRLADYEGAIGEATGALLKVHPSNFRVVGFTEEASPAAVASLAHRHALPAIYDQGSGALTRDGLPRGADLVTVSEAVLQGFDIVTCSTDKLMGGPQGGLILGRRELVGRIRGNPLYRALRVDKVTLLLLDATLKSYERDRAAAEIPIHRMCAMDCDDLDRRVERVLSALQGGVGQLQACPCDLESEFGGGSAPFLSLPSRGISLVHQDHGPDWLQSWLRGARKPVIARIRGDSVLLDFRTIKPEEDDEVVVALRREIGSKDRSGTGE